MKALGFQPVKSTSPFKIVVSDVINLHPYIMKRYGAAYTNLGVKTKCALGEYDNYWDDDEVSPGYDTWIKEFVIKTSDMVRRVQVEHIRLTLG